MKSFGIWCEVRGGITGHRHGWLKSRGRVVRYFTREAAEVIARERRAMHSPRSTAFFLYDVREIPDDEDMQ